MIGIMGCTDITDKQETAATGKDFTKTMGIADSLYNCMQFRDAYKLYLQLLGNKEVKTDSEKRLSVLNALSNTSELSGHKVEQHKWLQQLHDLAEQTGNDYYQSLAHITMGQNLFYEGDREKGIYSVTQGIDLMAKTDRENTDHLMHGYLNMLASMYGAMKDYDNALQTNERNLQLTMEGTRWGAAPNQQLIDRRMALAKMASVLAEMGRSASGRLQSKYYQQADSAYAAWKAVEYEGNHTRDYFIVDYMKKRGRYQEAIAIYNDLIQRVRQQGDTLGEMMNTTKWGLAEVYRRMGNCERAANLYEQVLEIQDTLKTRKAKHTAQELAAIYHDQEQEQMIMEQQTRASRATLIAFIIGILTLFAIAFSVIVFLKNREIKQKNRLLARQITDALNQKEKLRELLSSTKHVVEAGDKAEVKSEKAQRGEATASDSSDLNTLSDEQLFQQINDVIVREKLFLDPKFQRQVIIDRFQLSKERVGAIFSKGSEHANLSSYIQQLRLEYAAKLLIQQPEKSIIQIGTESGFSSKTYFSDRFRQYFGMSPTDFRMASSE
jgi:AraC-like DNA-binding protein